MAKSEKNTGWPGFFRLFAVLCAILCLLARQGAALSAATAGDQRVFRVYVLLTLWAVPALFMLWGMSALEDGKSASLSGMLLGYVLPTLVTLIVWGTVYAVTTHLLGGGSFSLPLIWQKLRAAARGSSPSYLSMLYSLIGLYLVLPVLRRFTSSAARGEVLWFLALCFAISSVLPRWLALRPNDLLPLLLDRLNVPMVAGYVGYFVGGWYLHHYVISRVSEYILYILGVAGLAVTLMADRFPGLSLDTYTAPGVVCTAAALCTLFRYVLGISEERSRRRAVYNLGRYAFGVYLVHQLWVLVFRWFGASLLAFPAVLSVPFFALIYFALSVPFALLIGLIPGLGGWLT